MIKKLIRKMLVLMAFVLFGCSHGNLKDESELSSEIEALRSQIQTLIDSGVKTKVFKDKSNRSIVAIIGNNNMVVHVIGNGSSMFSEINEETGQYTYYVNGTISLVIEGLTVNNLESLDNFNYFRIKDRFGTDLCNYIASAYTELVKAKGYRMGFDYYNPVCPEKVFYITKS